MVWYGMIVYGMVLWHVPPPAQVGPVGREEGAALEARLLAHTPLHLGGGGARLGEVASQETDLLAHQRVGAPVVHGALGPAARKQETGLRREAARLPVALELGEDLGEAAQHVGGGGPLRGHRVEAVGKEPGQVGRWVKKVKKYSC